MKVRPQAIFSFLLLIFFIVFVYHAQDWRLQARLYPWAIGIPMIILALIQLILDLKGVEQKQSDDATPMDYRFTQTVDPDARQTPSDYHVLLAVWLFLLDLAAGFLHHDPLDGFFLSQDIFQGEVDDIDYLDGGGLVVFLFPVCQVAHLALS